MPTPTLDARPRGVHLRFRPGTTFRPRLLLPEGFIDGHTFTSTLGDETLDVTAEGSNLRITASAEVTAAVGLVTATWLLVMDGEPVLGGLWSGSRSFADSGDVDATVVVEDLTVTVELIGGVGGGVGSEVDGGDASGSFVSEIDGGDAEGGF